MVASEAARGAWHSWRHAPARHTKRAGRRDGTRRRRRARRIRALLRRHVAQRVRHRPSRVARPGAGRRGHPRGVRRGVAGCGQFRPTPRLPFGLAQHDRPPQGGRPRAVRRAQRGRDQRHFEAAETLHGADTADLVVAADEGQRVREAIEGLPEAQRTALRLAYFEGRSYREVAEFLEVPLGTVKTRIRDALQRLKNQLGGSAMNDLDAQVYPYVVAALPPTRPPIFRFTSQSAPSVVPKSKSCARSPLSFRSQLRPSRRQHCAAPCWQQLHGRLSRL